MNQFVLPFDDDKTLTQGAIANANGRKFETQAVEMALANYRQPPHHLKNSKAKEYWERHLAGQNPPGQHVVLQQVGGLWKHWLGKESKNDLMIIRPDLRTAICEFRSQETQGSVDEKLPYLIMMLLRLRADHKIIVHNGLNMAQYGGESLTNLFMRGFGDLLNKSAYDNLLCGGIRIMTLHEFVAWHAAFVQADNFDRVAA